MDDMIACPACNAAITITHLFGTGTLLRFTCPHCSTRIQPTTHTFAIPWLMVAVAVGLAAGVAAAMIPGFATDAAARGLAYLGLGILLVGALVIIKWRASLALIRKGQLKVSA